MSNEGECEKKGSPTKSGDIKNCDEVGCSNTDRGCVQQSSPEKIKKRKKKNGPEKDKKKEKRKKKKEKEAHIPAQNTPASENSATQHIPQQNSDDREGVVRNPYNHFQPISSSSQSFRPATPASQVESIGDSAIAMGNNRFEKVMEKTKAEKLWCIAKNKLGVSTDDGDDEMYVERIMAMEERDKPAKGRKGKSQGPK